MPGQFKLPPHSRPNAANSATAMACSIALVIRTHISNLAQDTALPRNSSKDDMLGKKDEGMLHLAQAGSSNGLLLKRPEQVRDRGAQLRLNDGHGFGRSKCRHPVLQLGQLLCEGCREEV